MKISLLVKLLIFSTLLTLSYVSFSQVTNIKGRVLDAETSEPLPFCNVYISNSTLGTTTDIDGNYQLINVPDGEVEVAFSFIGFITFQQVVKLGKGVTLELDIALKPNQQQLSEVQIKTSRDKAWDKTIKKFQRYFLGEGVYAASCEITNPWLVDFKDDKNEKVMLASTIQPLEIRNQALGYTINFDLQEFVYTNQYHKIAGAVRFSEMETTDPAQAATWEKNRREVYLKSAEHLFKAIAQGRHKEAGFYLYTDKPGVNKGSYRSDIFMDELGKTVIEYQPEKLVEWDSIGNQYKIYLKGRVEIHYQNEYQSANTYRDAPFPITWIEVNRGVVFLNSNFIIQNPTDITYSGDMNNRRVATMLPLDYQPERQVLTKGKAFVSDAERLFEKVYLHTDRNYYYAGDQLLFKAYMSYNTPYMKDSLSKLLYIDLIGQDKKIIFTKKLKLENGVGAGDFFLPDTLSQTTYFLRAYTNWMRNYGEKYFFTKTLPVLGSKQRYIASYSQEVDAQSSQVKVDIKTDKAQPGKREKVKLFIQLSDERGQPVSANLSVAASSIQIANPAYQDITILETIHPNYEIGFSIGNIFNFPIEKDISLKGLFLGKNGKPAATPIQVFVDNFQGILDIESDKDGLFELTEMHFYGPMTIGLQAKDHKGKSYGSFEIQKNTPPVSNFSFKSPNQNITSAETSVYFSEDEEVTEVLDEVTVSTQPVGNYKNNIYGRPDYVVTADKLNIGGATDDFILSLKAQVPGMMVTSYYDGTQYTQQIRIRGGAASSLGSMEPLVMINGAPANSGQGGAMNNIKMLNPADIERVEIVSRMTSMLGDQGRNGIISIFLKDSQSTPTVSATTTGVSMLDVEGYLSPSLIANPNYEKDSPETYPNFDQRPTLYWNPYLITDNETGRLELEFFNNDLKSPIYIVVEGITTKGIPVRGTLLIGEEE